MTEASSRHCGRWGASYAMGLLLSLQAPIVSVCWLTLDFSACLFACDVVGIRANDRPHDRHSFSSWDTVQHAHKHVDNPRPHFRRYSPAPRDGFSDQNHVASRKIVGPHAKHPLPGGVSGDVNAVSDTSIVTESTRSGVGGSPAAKPWLNSNHRPRRQ